MTKSHIAAGGLGAALLLITQQFIHPASALTAARDMVTVNADGSTEIIVARSGVKTKNRVFPVVLKCKGTESKIKLGNGHLIDATGLREAGAALQKVADRVTESARADGAFDL